MSHLIKPIHNANEGNTKYPDWVIYPFGAFSRPTCILSELEMREFVRAYCEFHALEIKGIEHKELTM